MQKRIKRLGAAKRVRVRMPLGSSCSAWDCRPFGFGRIVAPVATGEIEIAHGVCLNLGSGALYLEATAQRRSA
jgi:hypothetical protein